MSLINNLNNGLNDFWRFLQMDVKDISYQFNVLFPKVLIYTEKMRIERVRQSIIYVEGHCNSNASLAMGRYVTTEDIQKRK